MGGTSAEFYDFFIQEGVFAKGYNNILISIYVCVEKVIDLHGFIEIQGMHIHCCSAFSWKFLGSFWAGCLFTPTHTENSFSGWQSLRWSM